MEPIINPWFIYLLQLVENLGVVSCFFMILGAVGTVVLTSITGMIVDMEGKEKAKQFVKTCRLKMVSIITTILILLYCLLPTKNTLIGIYATTFVTTTNIQKAIVAGKDVKNELKGDIIDIIKSFDSQKKVEKK